MTDTLPADPARQPSTDGGATGAELRRGPFRAGDRVQLTDPKGRLHDREPAGAQLLGREHVHQPAGRPAGVLDLHPQLGRARAKRSVAQHGGRDEVPAPDLADQVCGHLAERERAGREVGQGAFPAHRLVDDPVAGGGAVVTEEVGEDGDVGGLAQDAHRRQLGPGEEVEVLAGVGHGGRAAAQRR